MKNFWLRRSWYTDQIDQVSSTPDLAFLNSDCTLELLCPLAIKSELLDLGQFLKYPTSDSDVEAGLQNAT